MTLIKDCRQLSLEELKRLNKTKVLPLAIIASAYLISGEEEFLIGLPLGIKDALLNVDLNSLRNAETYKRLTSEIGETMVVNLLKEMYLSPFSDNNLKASVITFTLNEQVGLTEMLGYYYDQDAEHLIDAIKSEVLNKELIYLLIKRADTKQLKHKLLTCKWVYLSPSELLLVTKDNDMIVNYMFSHTTYASTHHLNIFKDLLKNISSGLLEQFNQKKLFVKNTQKGEILKIAEYKKQ